MTFFRTREHRLVVLGTIAAFGLMSIVRLAHVLTTGFMTNDEGLYMLSAILSAERGRIVISYPNRLLYVLMLGVAGLLFNLDNVYKVCAFLSLFNFAWTSACVVGFYKVAGLCFPDNRNLHIFIAGLPTLAMIAVANVAYLTEAMALAFLLLGTYLTCRLVQRPDRLRYTLGGLFIGIAFFIREPYGVVSLGMIAYMLCLAIRRKLPLLPVAMFIGVVLLTFRLPVDNSSMNFANFVFLEVSEAVHRVVESLMSIKVDLSWLRGPPPDTHSGGYAPPHLDDFEQEPMAIVVCSEFTGSMSVQTMFTAERFVYSAIYTVAGSLLGTNPVAFVLIVWGTLKMLTRWRHATEPQRVLVILSILSVLTVAGSGFLVGVPSEAMREGGLVLPWGTMARLSHTGLLAVLMIVPALGERRVQMPRRRLKAIALGVLIGLGLFGRGVVYTFERQFSAGYVNRVDFAYRAPYVRVFDHTEDTGRTLLYGGMNVALLNLYTRMRPDVFVAFYPSTEQHFLDLLAADDWDTVLFHATTHYTVDPTIESIFPFAWELLRGRTDYDFNVIWDDGDSFLYSIRRSCWQ